MNKTILKRITEVEKKLAANAQIAEEKKQTDDGIVLLRMMEYFRKFEEMTMTPEEITKADVEAAKQTLEWYDSWQKLSSQEQEEKRRKDFGESAEKARAWLNSEERKQFDIEYTEYIEKQKAAKNDPT